MCLVLLISNQGLRFQRLFQYSSDRSSSDFTEFMPIFTAIIIQSSFSSDLSPTSIPALSTMFCSLMSTAWRAAKIFGVPWGIWLRVCSEVIEILAHQWEFDRMKSVLRSLFRAFGLLGSLEQSFHKFASVSYLKTARVSTA